MSKVGTLVLQGNQYVVYDNNVRVILQKASHLIPGDEVEYADNNILRIVKRRQHATLAIVRGMTEGKSYLFCPLLGPLYNPYLETAYVIGTRLLVLIPANPDCQPALVRELGSLDDPMADLDALIKTYHSMATTTDITRCVHALEYKSPLYTMPDQDHRRLESFTIDPAGCKDADDALTVIPEENRVLVHIVDIHQQLADTAEQIGSHEVEIYAANKAFTLYLPNENAHILPKKLAEEDYSLRAGVARPVITVDITFRPGTMDVAKYEIYRDWIISRRAYSYEEVTPLLQSGAGPFGFLAALMSHVPYEHDLVIPSLNLTVDPSSELLSSYRAASNNDMAHKLIEKLMVIANMLVSKHLSEHPQTRGMYARIPQRFHSKLREGVAASSSLSPVVNSFLAIKTFAAARYDAHQTGHFGLSLPTYTHFTSPIRRYFDVILHHMLAGAVYGGEYLDRLLDHINWQERCVDGLQKVHRGWKLGRWIEGRTFHGVCTGVVKAGVQMLIEELMLDGFVHVSNVSVSGVIPRWTMEGSQLVANAAAVAIGTPLRITVTKSDVLLGTYEFKAEVQTNSVSNSTNSTSNAI